MERQRNILIKAP